jgi:hypothetical protein
MNGVANPLAREVRNKKIYGSLGRRRILIDTKKKIAGAENIQSLLVNAHIRAHPGAQVVREFGKWKARRNNLGSRAGLKH